MQYLIKTYTNEGDLVLDFACGSGTTAVAAKLLDRDFIMMELWEDYCKIARRRVAETGLATKAERLDAGVALTFEDLT